MMAEHDAGIGAQAGAGRAPTTKPVEIFYSYAHKDEDLRNELEKHLALLRQQGLIAPWHDRKIVPGTDWAREIDIHLNSADIILLLISADFLASDYCSGIEMKRALERYEAGEARVVPILLRSVYWKNAPFAHLQALPKEGKPVDSSLWHNHDEAFTNVVEGIHKVIEQLRPNGVNANDQPSPAPTQNTSVFNIPFAQNPYFTGREEVLKRLHDALSKNGTAALSQPAAISGLGGIGKTQTAVEYAYRHRDEYHYVFWLRAETASGLAADYATIAELVNLPESNQPNQDLKVAAVKRWLQSNSGWLLIFDNADDISLVQPYLPMSGKGHIILTTRAQSPGRLAQKIAIEKMEPDEGTLFLLHRSGILPDNAPIEQAAPTDCAKALEIVNELDALPLALEQAASYIDQTSCGLEGYLQRYRNQRGTLLKHNPSNPDYSKTVATSWNLSFQIVEAASPAAADLLRLCAFLAPDAIPEEIITAGAAELGPNLKPLSDPIQLDAAIQELRKYSLIKRDPSERILSIHRLVQAVLLDQIPKRQHRTWAERTIRAVNAVFPSGEYGTWPQCKRLLPQAQTCATLVEQYNLAIEEAAFLLRKAGRYLIDQGQYTQVQPLYQRALHIDEQVSGPEQRDTGVSLNNLALLYYLEGKYEQAEPLFQRALKICEQKLDPDDPEIAATLDNLGQLYERQGRYVEAEQYYQRALDIQERVLGEHPRTAITLFSMGVLYTLQERYEQAELLFQHSLTIRENVFGSEHPNVATCLESYADLLRKMGRTEEAVKMEQRARRIREKWKGQ
jgi:tetratricopeptide (TPR) repeat protein